MLKQFSEKYDDCDCETEIRKGRVTAARFIVMHVCICSSYLRACQRSSFVCSIEYVFLWVVIVLPSLVSFDLMTCPIIPLVVSIVLDRPVHFTYYDGMHACR